MRIGHKDLQERLRAEGVTATIRINDNIHTYVSIFTDRKKGMLRLSLHRIFLEAPEEILQALISYVVSNKKNAKQVLRQFVSQRKNRLDYSHHLDKISIETEGQVYNIKEIFHSINEKYFEGQLNLSVTYFGKENKKAKTTTLGLYCDVRRLIKIHKILDHACVPRYVVEYVMYHEMLHAVMPPSCTNKGVIRVHDTAFKAKEKSFSHFMLAKIWIKNHLKTVYTYGRT